MFIVVDPFTVPNSTVRQLPKTANVESVGSPVVSPDGGLIAYNASPDGIYTVSPFFNEAPTFMGSRSILANRTLRTWSPDGVWLLVFVFDPNTGTWSLVKRHRSGVSALDVVVRANLMGPINAEWIPSVSP